MQNKIVNCNGIEIANNKKVVLIAGPCQLESEQHAMDMSGKIKEISSSLGQSDRKKRIYSHLLNARFCMRADITIISSYHAYTGYQKP